ncbi:glycosyltransferase [Idiomarina sp.]|uniref:glycosyltransferase n=1 Tax=Idiomarina sp. TaxID=1874361 RepID=UPI0025BCEA7D|nr:glycosyltransferase [Idiomarina sp.]NQZ04707.1 glycosyltransferase [Idiomarina sp.]
MKRNKIYEENKYILFVSPTSILGGAERVMQNLARALIVKGYHVDFFSMSRGEQSGWDELTKESNFNLIQLGFKSEKAALIPVLVMLLKLSTRRKYKACFSSHTHVNGLLSLLRKLKVFNVDFLIGRESTFIFERFKGFKRSLFKAIYRLCYGDHDLLIAQTEGMKKSLIKNLGFIPAKKFVTIQNPVSPTLESFINNKTSFDVHKSDVINICACGRMIPIKNFESLIRAFHLLVTKSNNVKLHLVGSGPLFDHLKLLARNLDVSNDVIFHGKVQDPIRIFSMCEVGVIPSVSEGFPNVLLEMMCSGVARIGSTLCTDAVLSIPRLKIARTPEPHDLLETLESLVANREDYSAEYQKYVLQKHSSSKFLMEVVNQLKG